jgi:putative Mn2+ efflux pump MntP
VNYYEIFLIAISMAMDAFAVCLAAGTREDSSTGRITFRLAFHFGLFQFLMPVIGWLAGSTIGQYITSYDHWIALGLLALVGGRMIWSGFHQEKEAGKIDPSRGLTLVLLSIAVSIDALAVGLSLGIIGMTIWVPAVVIGIVTGLISWLGMRLGNKLGEKFGKRMELVGGIILIMIGVRILLAHLLA